jgi:hypothetical protein
MQQPSIGRIVHYVSHGTPILSDGSQAFDSRCRTALVTEVDPENITHVGLCAINPTGFFFHSLADGGCYFDSAEETPGDPKCPIAVNHGNPFRYCQCGWIEGSYTGGTWHFPERVE